jgi:hypothetical protein
VGDEICFVEERDDNPNYRYHIFISLVHQRAWKKTAAEPRHAASLSCSTAIAVIPKRGYPLHLAHQFRGWVLVLSLSLGIFSI